MRLPITLLPDFSRLSSGKRFIWEVGDTKPAGGRMVGVLERLGPAWSEGAPKWARALSSASSKNLEARGETPYRDVLITGYLNHWNHWSGSKC